MAEKVVIRQDNNLETEIWAMRESESEKLVRVEHIQTSHLTGCYLRGWAPAQAWSFILMPATMAST